MISCSAAVGGTPLSPIRRADARESPEPDGWAAAAAAADEMTISANSHIRDQTVIARMFFSPRSCY
jgi:hypothetical protein